MNKLPVYELIINDIMDEIIGIALVDEPAIQEDFIYFNEVHNVFNFNDEKMIVKGAALIPNQRIYRTAQGNLPESYVYFTEESIFKFVEKLMDKKEHQFNLSHSNNYFDATIIESYFAEEVNEFNVPKGSWIVALKIKDNKTWEDVKKGIYNGFSVQTPASYKFVEYFQEQKIETKNNMKDLKEKLLNFVNEILFSEEVEKVEEVVEKVEVEEAVEVVEEKVEEVKIDVEVVEEVKLAEDVIEVEPVEEPETEKEMSNEEMLIKISEMMDAMKQEILQVVDEKIANVNMKVEEFGNQPVAFNKNIEEVTSLKDIDTPAMRFFSKNK